MLHSAHLADARHHPRASIFDININQRNPTRKIILRNNKIVSIVLVPGELLGTMWFLVDRLIDVEPVEIEGTFGRVGGG